MNRREQTALFFLVLPFYIMGFSIVALGFFDTETHWLFRLLVIILGLFVIVILLAFTYGKLEISVRLGGNDEIDHENDNVSDDE